MRIPNYPDSVDHSVVLQVLADLGIATQGVTNVIIGLEEITVQGHLVDDDGRPTRTIFDATIEINW